MRSCELQRRQPGPTLTRTEHSGSRHDPVPTRTSPDPIRTILSTRTIPPPLRPSRPLTGPSGPPGPYPDQCSAVPSRPEPAGGDSGLTATRRAASKHTTSAAAAPATNMASARRRRAAADRRIGRGTAPATHGTSLPFHPRWFCAQGASPHGYRGLWRKVATKERNKLWTLLIYY